LKKFPSSFLCGFSKSIFGVGYIYTQTWW
jgi:hypothetical protein